MASINKYADNYGSHALRLPNNETKWHYKGSVSTPLSTKRFDINKSGLSATVKKRKTNGVRP